MARIAKPKQSTSGRVKLRRKKLKDGGESLYLDTYANGKRSYEFLDLRLTGGSTADRELLRLAETKRAQREVELAMNGTGIVPAHAKGGSFLDFFAGLAEEKGHPAWKGAHGHLLAFSGGVLRFGEISPTWVAAFRRYLLEDSGLSQNSCALYWQKFRCALKEAVQRARIHADPAQHVKNIQMQSTERIFLTINEVRVLYSTPCANNAVRLAFLFSCFVGLRVSDLYRLTWDAIDGDSLTLRVKKTGVVESLPLSGAALQVLDEARQDGEASGTERVFDLPPQRTGSQILLRWSVAAGVKKQLHWHVARHTCAMLHISGGSDVFTVSKLLGHKSINSTLVYARIQDEQKRTAIDKLPEL